MADDNGVPRSVTIKPDPDPTLATRELVNSAVAALRDTVIVRIESFEAAQKTFHDGITRVPTLLDKGLATARDYSDAQTQRVLEHAKANFEINTQKFAASEDLRRQTVERMNERIEAIVAIVTANKVEADAYRELIAEQTRKNSTDVDAAVKAAFAASTLAVTQQNIANALASDKQGAAFTKDIEKLTVSLAQIQKSSDDKLEEVRKNNDQRVNDMKDRIGQMEARSGVSDPATARALQEMAGSISRLSSGADIGQGRFQQKQDISGWIMGIVAIIIAAAAVLVDVFVAHK